MVINQLHRIEALAKLERAEFSGFAQRARVLCIPKGRWIAQRGRGSSLYCFLLRGVVRTYGPNRKLRSSPVGKIAYFFPGCDAARTDSTCHILCIERSQWQFLTQAADTELKPDQADAWLKNFLHSDLMQRLSRESWQDLLRAFSVAQFDLGQTFVRQGDPATECYVLEKGRAVIHRGGSNLRYLNPGDLFGEDGLLLGSSRNAYVTAQTDLLVRIIDAHNFRKLMLDPLLRYVEAVGPGEVLDLDCLPRAMRHINIVSDLRSKLSEFAQGTCYYLVGGELAERELAAFLMIQYGLDARVVA